MSKLIQIGLNAYITYDELPECPQFDLDCPYCLSNGKCSLENVADECDEYAYYYEEEE